MPNETVGGEVKAAPDTRSRKRSSEAGNAWPTLDSGIMPHARMLRARCWPTSGSRYETLARRLRGARNPSCLRREDGDLVLLGRRHRSGADAAARLSSRKKLLE